MLDEKYAIKDETIEDCVYEFQELSESIIKLNVKNETETVEILAKNPKSFARYGDGEVSLMRGEDSAFQSYDAELARKMKEILIRKRDNIRTIERNAGRILNNIPYINCHCYHLSCY